MKLVAAIVNYKTADMTLDAASAAIEQLRDIGGEWRLVIVDNDSQDGSYERITLGIEDRIGAGYEEWKQVEVLKSDHNGGYGAGNNLAIKKYLDHPEAPEFFYILNSDAFPEKHSISSLIDHLTDNPRTGIAGSYIHGVDGDPHPTAFRFPSIFSELLEGPGGMGRLNKVLEKYVVPMGIPSQTIKVDWLAGASMLIRRDTLLEVGMFDEKFFLYYEETDLCRRAKRKGWDTAYVKESSVGHIGSQSTGMKNWSRIPVYWLDSRRHYFIKNHGRTYYYVATMARILGGLLYKIKARFHYTKSGKPDGFFADLTRHTLRMLLK